MFTVYLTTYGILITLALSRRVSIVYSFLILSREFLGSSLVLGFSSFSVNRFPTLTRRYFAYGFLSADISSTPAFWIRARKHTLRSPILARSMLARQQWERLLLLMRPISPKHCWLSYGLSGRSTFRECGMCATTSQMRTWRYLDVCRRYFSHGVYQ